MTFGMTAPQFEVLNRLVIKPLKDAGVRVFLFGSRATGKHHPHSDVDLLYKLPTDNVAQKKLISKVKGEIEESLFPYTVDLVSEKDLAESYRENVMTNLVEL